MGDFLSETTLRWMKEENEAYERERARIEKLNIKEVEKVKTFFEVQQADNYEGYSGRFNVHNCYLDISTEAYQLDVATDEFLKKFREEYHYWVNIYDKDLNKEALATKNRFKEFEEAYARI